MSGSRPIPEAMRGGTQSERWYCHECHTTFAEPYLNGGNDLPLCPACRSDVVEEREDDTAEDSTWFPGPGRSGTDSGGGSARSSFDSPLRDRTTGGGGSGGRSSAAVQGLMGSFRPPSGMGGGGARRQGMGQTQQGDPAGPGTAAGEILSGLLGGILGGQAGSSGSGSTGSNRTNASGPRTRTFQWGSAGGGGSASITFGTPSGNPFTALGGGTGGGGFGTALFGPGVGDAAFRGGARPASSPPRAEGSGNILGGRPRSTASSPAIATAHAAPATAPPERAGTHWHVGEDELGRPIEYEVYEHDADEEGIPVIDEQTGEMRTRPYVPQEGDDAEEEPENPMQGMGVRMGMGGPFAGGPFGAGRGGPFGHPAGRQPQTMEEMLASLMDALNDPRGPGMAHIVLGGGGPGGIGGPIVAGNPGDYVFTQEGLDAIMEQIANQGHRPPPPASQTVIEGLPRVRLDQASLNASQYKDCSVCQDDFELGQEVIKVPCKHIFHPDCLVPWLQTNGTCPVCRFSLVSEEERERAANQPLPTVNIQNPQQNAPNPLAGLFGGIANWFGGGQAQQADHPEQQQAPAGSTAQGSSSESRNVPGGFPEGSADVLGATASEGAVPSLPPPIPASRPPNQWESGAVTPMVPDAPVNRSPPGPSPLGANDPLTASTSAGPSGSASNAVDAASRLGGEAFPQSREDRSGEVQAPVTPYPNAIPQEHRERFTRQEAEMRRQQEGDGGNDGGDAQ